MNHPWDPQQFATGAKAEGRDDTVIGHCIQAGRTIKHRDNDLPVILTLAHLAHLTDTPPRRLEAYAKRRTADPYRVFQLRKRQHGAPKRAHRTICVPEPPLMRLQRWIAQNLLQTTTAAPHPASYAYYRGKNPDRGLRAAALRHAGCTWLVKMDIRDFFDSLTESRIYRVFRQLGYGALLSFQLARICTRVRSGDPHDVQWNDWIPAYYNKQEGRLPQGAPTSPSLANLAVRALDERLDALARSLDWTYTRYADDLAFSTRKDADRAEARQLVDAIRRELVGAGLRPNNAKTVIAGPGARRLVLGLLVDGPEPRLTREFRTRLETHLRALTSPTIGAAKHCQTRNFASLIGMRHHIGGLIAFAYDIDKAYGQKRFDEFNSVDWTR